MLRHPLITLIDHPLDDRPHRVPLYVIVPQGFFPQQDTGRLTGSIIADQDTSFQSMNDLLRDYCIVVGKDPDVAGVDAFVGGQHGRGAEHGADVRGSSPD